MMLSILARCLAVISVGTGLDAHGHHNTVSVGMEQGPEFIILASIEKMKVLKRLTLKRHQNYF